jgi:hypothetical protein
MRECSPFGLQSFSCLFPFFRLPLRFFLSLQGVLRLTDLALECGDASLCRCHGFDGLDCTYFPEAHVDIYAATVSIPQPA